MGLFPVLRTKQELGRFSSRDFLCQGRAAATSMEKICLGHSQSGRTHQLSGYLFNQDFCSEKTGKRLISTQESRDGNKDLVWGDIPAPQLPDVSKVG